MKTSESGNISLKVLIVDDDHGLLRLLERALKEQGLASISASSGKEAITRLEETNYALMLLDLKLEDIQARELVDRLALAGRSVPFVIITGQGDERAAVEMMKRGAIDYLVKDFQFLELVPRVVRRALDQIQKDRKLAELTRELAEKVVELEGFSHSVSHDMRAPLRAMQSFACFLKDEYGNKLDEQGLNYIEQIMRSATRLDQLIKDVLSYTRILHTKLPIGPVDLDLLVRDIVAICSAGKEPTPDIRIEGELPRVIGNETLLTQTITNLLENGMKFASPNQPNVIEISAKKEEVGWVRINFKDNGIGIAPENQERIFRLFEKVHSPADYQGTGLGLSIVSKACQRMGAQAGVESELGKGSVFWIKLKQA